MPDEPEYLTTDPAAKLLGKTRQRLHQLAREGRIAHRVLAPGRKEYLRADIEREAANPRPKTGRPVGS